MLIERKETNEKREKRETKRDHGELIHSWIDVIRSMSSVGAVDLINLFPSLGVFPFDAIGFTEATCLSNRADTDIKLDGVMFLITILPTFDVPPGQGECESCESKVDATDNWTRVSRVRGVAE